jgi:hypothetical protein
MADSTGTGAAQLIAWFAACKGSSWVGSNDGASSVKVEALD